MRFELLEPRTTAEAVSLLSAHRNEARVIAGGQSLLLMIRSGLVRPRFLLSVGPLEEWAGIKVKPDGALHIGALATHRQILESQHTKEKASILTQAACRIGSTPVRNLGTIGGNLCHNEMGSDPPPALLALDAVAECVSPRGARKIPLSELFTGYFETCLEPDELLVGLAIPPQPEESRGIYLKHTMRPGDLAIVGVAALATLREGVCDDIKLALGGVGPVPFRAHEAEGLLRGKSLNASVIGAAARAAAEASDPLSDAHASAEYRRKMVRVFAKRALDQILGDAKGDK
ncbi:MAG: FAD binding domain-containing protein [Candidatus Binatia bacterium]